MRTSIICLFILAPALSFAQSWDVSIAALYQDSLSVGGTGGSESATPDTSSFSMKSELGFGFNITYNFNPHLALGLDLDYLKPDYTAILVPEDVNEQPVQIDHNLTQFNTRIKGTYSFIDGPFTPYIDIGYGWTNVDSNVADGPPVTGCWWHPWWGYICNNYYSTFSTTESSWGGAVGLRYNIRGGSFLKLSWNRWEFDSGSNSEDLTLEAARLEYGWNF